MPGEAPVALDADPPAAVARLRDHQVRGRELARADEDRGRVRHVAERQVVVQRLRIDHGLEAAREETLRLGTEEDRARCLGEVERLDPEAVTGEEEAVPARIPEREGEHALQPADRVHTLLLVEVGDHLDIRSAAEAMPPSFERGAQRSAVINLAVAHHLHRAILVGERLLAAAHVDDREPAHAERHLGVREQAVVVWPAVHHHVAHGAHALGAGALTECQAELSGDAAHG